MIPFQKIFTLLIRTFSGPMLRYFRHKQKLKDNSFVGRLFIGLGRRTLAIQHWINYRMLKTLTPKRHKHISQQMLLQKGVQTFYQVLFYMIVLGLPFWQLYKGSQASTQKERTLQKRIKSLQTTLNKVNGKIDKVHGMILNRQLQREQMKQKKKRSEAQKTSKLNSQQELDNLDEDDKQQPEKHVDLEQILQHAVQVIADEFQDSLDELPYVEDNSEIDLQQADSNQTDNFDSQMLGEIEGEGVGDDVENENFLFDADQLTNTIDLVDAEGGEVGDV